MNKPTAQTRVLYADTDQMGVVNNVVYLRWFELGRAEFLRERGTPYKKIEEAGFRFPVVEAHVRYRDPARYDDIISIEVLVEDVRAASCQFAYTLRRAGDSVVLCDGWTRHACIGADGKLKRFPDFVLALLRP